MQFEEIMRIDRTPFEEGWMEKFYEQGLHFGADTFYCLSIALLHHILGKFNNEYGTNMKLLDDERLILDGSLKASFEEGTLIVDYESNCYAIFKDMGTLAGFDRMEIDMEFGSFESQIWKAEKKEQKRLLKKSFRTYAPSWRPFLWKNLENMKDSYNCLESGSIFILRNRDIGLYRIFCSRYKKLVESKLYEEAKALDDVIQDLRFPLYFQNIAQDGYLGDFYYIYFDTGFNGYESLEFTAFNFHWAFSCFVFQKLMQDFRKKINRFMDIEPELRKTP